MICKRPVSQNKTFLALAVKVDRKEKMRTRNVFLTQGQGAWHSRNCREERHRRPQQPQQLQLHVPPPRRWPGVWWYAGHPPLLFGNPLAPSPSLWSLSFLILAEASSSDSCSSFFLFGEVGGVGEDVVSYGEAAWAFLAGGYTTLGSGFNTFWGFTMGFNRLRGGGPAGGFGTLFVFGSAFTAVFGFGPGAEDFDAFGIDLAFAAPFLICKAWSVSTTSTISSSSWGFPSWSLIWPLQRSDVQESDFQFQSFRFQFQPSQSSEDDARSASHLPQSFQPSQRWSQLLSQLVSQLLSHQLPREAAITVKRKKNNGISLQNMERAKKAQASRQQITKNL